MTIEKLRTDGLILLEVIVGSQAYGLAHAESDTDIKGVFYLPKEKFYKGESIVQVSDEKNDIVYYELGRFIELLSKSNPTVLEMLATPVDCILYKHPLFDKLDLKELLSLEAINSFANYAMLQVQKAKGLNKKINNPVAKERKTLLDFCYVIESNDAVLLKNWLDRRGLQQKYCGLAKLNHCKGLYGLYYSEDINYKGVLAKEDSCEVSCSSIPKGEKLEAYLVVNQDAFAQHCKNYREYFEWESKRNESRFQTNLAHNAGYDSKNMMHTIRLMEVAKQILQRNELVLRAENRDELLKIKKGLYTYDELLKRAIDLYDEIELLRDQSHLRESIDKEKLKLLLYEWRSYLYH